MTFWPLKTVRPRVGRSFTKSGFVPTTEPDPGPNHSEGEDGRRPHLRPDIFTKNHLGQTAFLVRRPGIALSRLRAITLFLGWGLDLRGFGRIHRRGSVGRRGRFHRAAMLQFAVAEDLLEVGEAVASDDGATHGSVSQGKKRCPSIHPTSFKTYPRNAYGMSKAGEHQRSDPEVILQPDQKS